MGPTLMNDEREVKSKVEEPNSCKKRKIIFQKYFWLTKFEVHRRNKLQERKVCFKS